MNRRALLKYTAYLTGYAVTAPLTSAILSGCKAEEPTIDFTPAFFTSDEYENVAAMVNTMLPPTSTPGAKELGVPQFIDLVLSIYTEEKDMVKIRTGLNTWTQTAAQEAGKPYYELKPEEQLDLLNKLDAEARQQADELTELGQNRILQGMPKDPTTLEDEEDKAPWWLMLKDLAIGGYYSSEKIGTEVLAYDPVPGPYQGCIPLEDVGKTWSLN